MKNFAHVPVQTWRGWDPNELFGGWFSALGGFKTLIGTIGLILGAFLLLPSGSPGAMVYQDYFGNHYRKKSSHTCNDAMKIQIPRSR
jgi:hypothetical protein